MRNINAARKPYASKCHLQTNTTWGHAYKEKQKLDSKTYLKCNMLEHTKLRNFWAHIVSWAPIDARNLFIALGPGYFVFYFHRK